MSENLRERLKKKRQKIKERSSGGNVVFLKEGTTRIRVLPTGEEKDWSFEMVHFYLGPTVKGIFSAASIGKPCPIMEYYNGLKETDKDAAKRISPRSKALVPVIVYEDDMGKKVDAEKSGKLVMIPNTALTQMIDFYLDPDMGDFTDPVDGYDLKIKRTGTGLTDTEYSVIPVKKNSPIPKGYEKPVDLRKMVESAILSEEAALEKLAQFLEEGGHNDSDEEEAPRPKKKVIKKRT
jgi:hypothetical protein